MTPSAASIERARAGLRDYLNSGKAHHDRLGFLSGVIVCLRIAAGEIPVKLKKPRAIF